MKNKVALMFLGNTVLLTGLCIALIAVSPFWGILAAICAALLTVAHHKIQQNQTELFDKKLEQALKHANETANSSTKQLLMELPLPCLITDEEGIIQWFNVAVNQLFPGKKLIGESVVSLLPQCAQLNEKAAFVRDVQLGEKTYSVIAQKLEGEWNARGLTFLEVTRERELESLYESGRIAAGSITIDNYTEVMSGLTEGEQNKLIMELETTLYRWASPLEGMFRRIDRDRFLLIVDQQHLNCLLEEKFLILNEVKKIKGYQDIPVTLSIGVGTVCYMIMVQGIFL